MGKHNKELPPRPSGSRERERHRSKERTEAIRERSRSRAPSNSSAGSSVPFPDYYLRAGNEERRGTPPLPVPSTTSSSRRANREEAPERENRLYKPSSHPNTLQKPRRKDPNVPKLTIRKPEERDFSLPEVHSATTPSQPGFSKFSRGRPRTKESPTIGQYPRTPRELPPPNPSSPPPPMPQRRPSEPPSSSGSGQRSTSSDGRITSKLKASKAVVQSQGNKWTQKGQSIWGKLTSKNPKSAVFAPANFGTFPSKPRIDVVGMPLHEATIKTRVAKELVAGVDASAYWLPAMAYRLIAYLNVHGPEEQGIYRVPGSTAAVDKMRDEFAARHDFDLFQDPPDDVNTASSLLKSFVRSLPEPILTPKFQEDLFEKVREQRDAKQPPQTFVDMLSSLPPQNYYLLQVLTNHLSNVRLAEDVTRMGLSNLAMIFCSTMKLDRYIFHWLVGSWSDCWGGCWAEEQMVPAGSVRISFDTKSETSKVPSGSRQDDMIGLGIRSNGGRSVDGRSREGRSHGGRSHDGRSNDGRSHDGRRTSQEFTIPLPPLPTPREPAPRQPSPSAHATGKSSRKRMSGVHDAPDTTFDPERGRKRTSREMDWPSPPTPGPGVKHHRRLSSAESIASVSSTSGNAGFGGFTSGSTIRQVPRDNDPLSPRINELIGSFRLRARDRRSVDISQLAILAQQASLNTPQSPSFSSPGLDSPRHRQSPLPPIEPLRPRDVPQASNSRNASQNVQGSTKSKQGQQQRARSAERSNKPREVELLPPMPPLSPLMATGNNYGHF
ncbi:Beta-chimaerin [Dactylellina cionopaga]|nr:Beta-chimaerin [Dactylellina cionopaga]